MDNFDKFTELINYIEANLDADIEPKKMAQILCVNEYTMYRIFTFLKGIVLSYEIFYIVPNNSNIIFVVEKAKDISLFEKINIYNGKYHVLGGLISPLDGIGPDDININKLIDRIDKESVHEIIMALKPSIEGETTMQYIKKILENKNVRVTRIATGIPMGTDIEYIDAMTLEFALEGRKDI